MTRKIIQIDEERCNGCGACAEACHEGAIGMVDGRARLLREDYCDGLGDCLPACPVDAISFVEKETDGFAETADHDSKLSQWPVQIKLVSVNASCLDGADLLIAADCTAYAYGDLHNRFIRDKVTLIGCPKLDGVDYGDKLTDIFRENDISSITVVRMEVPCCGGLERAVKAAVEASGKEIPWQLSVVSTDGKIING